MGFNPIKGVKNIFKGGESLFRGGKNPAEGARQYFDEIPAYGREAYNPFIQQGQEAWGKLDPQYEKFLNPQQMLNEDVSGYEPSQYYQTMAPYLNESMENTAAAGGYAGNPYDQRQRGDMVRQLMSADLGSYLDRVGQNRMQGIQGYESATGRGNQAAGSLADFLGTSSLNRGNLEYAGKTQQGINKNAFISSLMSAVSGGYGNYMGRPKDDQQQPGGQQTGQQTGQQGLRGIQTQTPYGGTRQYGGRGNIRGGY